MFRHVLEGVSKVVGGITFRQCFVGCPQEASTVGHFSYLCSSARRWVIELVIRYSPFARSGDGRVHCRVHEQ